MYSRTFWNRGRRGFTLIELLVVIAIIVLLSSIILSIMTTARMRARDGQRIANAHQIAIALDQYELANGTYKVAGAGESNGGGGYVAKVGGTYSTAIVAALKSGGLYSSDKLSDPIYGTDNYYLGQCASTSAYTLFLKVEQQNLQNATSSISAACDGTTALGLGFNYIASSGGVGVSGGAAGGGSTYTPAGGVVDTTFAVGAGFDGEVFALAAQSDGKILAAGDFLNYNGTGRTRIARLNSDGSLDTSFNPGSGAAGTVYAVKQLPSGKIMIGGNFLSYNGTPITRVARLNSNGTLDGTFNPGTGPNAYLNDIVVQPDGAVLIGGYFSAYNGVGAMGVVRLLDSGAIDETFDHNVNGTNGTPSRMALQPDGKVVVAGSFFQLKWSSLAYVARFNSNGSIDGTFNPGTGPGAGSVTRIALQPDGKIILVGTFSTFNGFARTSLVRLDSFGSVDTTLNAGVWTNGIPTDVSVLSDGKIMVVGATTWDVAVPDYVTRFMTTGAADITFNYNKAGANQVVDAVLPLADGTLIIGGNFTAYNGGAINRIAKLK